MIIIKTLIAQFKNRRLLTLSLIFALTITLIFVSSLYSSIIYNKQIYKIQNNNYLPEETISYTINSINKGNCKIDKSSFIELCNKADIMLQFEYNIGSVQDRVQMLFSKNKEPQVALYDDNIIKKAKNNYAYLGNNIRDEFKKYVEINGVKYNIGGVAGVKNRTTSFDESITIYTNNMDNVLNAFSDENVAIGMFITLYSKDIDKGIRESFNKTFKTEYFDTRDITMKDSKYDAIKMENSKRLITLILVGLLSVITISTFWIIDRRKEISIKRAFGAKNRHIIFEIYKELLSLCIFCGVLSIICNLFIYKFLNTVNFIQLKMSLSNIFMCFIGVIIISIITSVFPIYKALREEIISGLKGGKL